MVAADSRPAAQPHLTCGPGCDFLASGVDNHQFNARRHPSRRGEAAVLTRLQVIGLAQRGDRLQALGSTVDLQENVAEALLELAELARAHRRSAVVDRLQAGQVVIAGRLEVEQAVQQGRHQRTNGDPFGGNVAAPLAQVRQVLGERTAATKQRRQHTQPRTMADRRHVQ
ncbi:hypothetical protein D3C77_423410 [compost metagenome]